MRNVILSVILFSFCNLLSAQDFKALASKEIDAENYASAVRYLERAVASDSNDAEAWYLLGHSLHWLSYDSAPLPGFDQPTSDRILDCMQKALAIDPHLRSCYGVIGSEYGARAVQDLQLRNSSQFIQQLLLARRAGAFPDWLLEYARNILNSCKPHAILFTGGDAEVFPVWYSQVIDSVRRDVTLVPVPLLDRPWFILTLQSGVANLVVPVSLPWTREQILALHASKWEAQITDIPISPAARRAYASSDSAFQWTLSPDLQRDDRHLLSINRIVILGILKANNWNRPVHFSLGCQQWMFSDLGNHLQLCAMTRELVPFSTGNTGRTMNLQANIRFLTQAKNFRELTTLKDQDIPYISPPLHNYRAVYLMTCDSLLRNSDFNMAQQIYNAMQANIPESLLPMSEGMRTAVDDLHKRIQAFVH